MNNLVREIGFVVYPVSDVAKSRAFYTDALGFKETANWQDQWIEYDLGPGTLAITSGQPGTQPGAGGAMAALEVTDFDAMSAFLAQRNIPWSSTPFDSPVCRGGMIKDPDGNLIMIHQKKVNPS
jgi:catechol 2,3-dioxygenase-like lactoylglutathione lyase family enzyme